MLTVMKQVNLKLATDPARGNVQTFLERLLVEVTAANYRYFLNELLVVKADAKKGEKPEHMCWPPLLANERQVSGLFASALSTLCPISRPEHSISRTREGDDGEVTRGGRIDFLATYGNRDIALELKRLPISSIGEAEEKQVLVDRWSEVSTQSKEALAHMRAAEQNTYLAPVSIGLLVVRISRKVTSKKSHEAVRGDAAASLEKVLKGVLKATKPDFLAYYKPPVEMQTVRGWGQDGSEFRVFPGVIFAAIVHGNTRSVSGSAD